MNGSGGNCGSQVLFSTEAEAYIQALITFDVKEIGSPRWNQQHEYLEKLNMQAVVNASQNEDEFVKEYFISYEKIPLLIYDLIATEVWKQRVFPEFDDLGLENDLLFPFYVVLHHEATVINLLETILFHQDACEALTDASLDLVDYCYRKLTYLTNPSCLIEDEDDTDTDPLVALGNRLSATSFEELQKQDAKLNFNIGIKCLTILRYMIDHLQCLPLSAATRILNTHDVPLLLVQFIESPPWSCFRKGKQMKYVDSKWQIVEGMDCQKLTKVEGQVWIALFQLLMSSENQNKYEFNSYRKGILMKLRPHLTELLLDQIPVLCEFQRFLDQLTILEPPPAKNELILEQIPEMWDNFVKKYDGKWREIAKDQIENYFNTSKMDMRESARKLAETYSMDLLENLIPEPPKCAVCGQPAAKRCSRCQNEWYCRRECQVSHWAKHKKVCDMLQDSLPKDSKVEVSASN